MNARLYDPLLARFLAPYPQVSESETSNGYNRYIYASNNPMMYVDINGEQEVIRGGIFIPGYNHSTGNSIPELSGTNNNLNPGSNNFGNSLYNPGHGSNSGSQGGSYGGDFGGDYGGSGFVTVDGLGYAVVGFLQWLFGPHISQDSYKATLTSTSTSNSYTKKITLKNPVGTGASTVYSGGGTSRGGNSSASWLSGAQYGLPVWGASKQFQDAINNSDYLNAACFLGLGFFEAFSFGEGTGVRLEMNAAKAGAQGFRSFSAFKRVMGPAGESQAWHYIVEQTPANVERFGAEGIHNTENLMRLPHGTGSIHTQISGYYSSKQWFSNGQTVRKWLNTQSYQEQYNFGIQTLTKFGWTP